MARGLLGIVKLILFVMLLPIIIAVIAAFQKEAAALQEVNHIFWWGVVAYVIVHLFVFTPQGLFQFWQGVFLEVCSFAGVVANAIVLAVPIITTILLLAYLLVTAIFQKPLIQQWLLFFTGFTLALHVVLGAQELYDEDESKLKGHYLFALGLTFIANMLIVVSLFDLIFKDFTFRGFWDVAYETAKDIYLRCAHLVHLK